MIQFRANYSRRIFIQLIISFVLLFLALALNTDYITEIYFKNQINTQVAIIKFYQNDFYMIFGNVMKDYYQNYIIDDTNAISIKFNSNFLKDYLYKVFSENTNFFNFITD